MSDHVVVTAVLHDGPRDGHVDWIVQPLPRAVYVAWCEPCRREHVHPLGAGDVGPLDAAVYELVDEVGMTARYAWVDVDDALDELAFIEQLPAGA